MRPHQTLLGFVYLLATACAPSHQNGERRDSAAADTGAADTAAAGAAPAVLTASAAATATAAPDSGKESGPDYRLTPEIVDRFLIAERNVYERLMTLTPAEVEQLIKPEPAGYDSDGTPPDDVVEANASHPAIAAAIRAAGITTGQYFATKKALFAASMALLYLASNPGANADSLAQQLETHPDNLALVREREEEIHRRQRANAEVLRGKEP